MADPNPGRGMPAALQRYWLTGKGAAKIRWNVPGDFKRCVRAIRRYFPTEPEGLCNILHTKATGGPPGHGSNEHAITAAAKALLAVQPKLGELWYGPIAPINRPTGEPRRLRLFEHGALTHRELPLPLRWQKVSGQGHDGAVTVGRMLGITYGPDENGQDWAYAFGDWLDEKYVPEVREARYLNDKGIVGPSVDPGGLVVAELNPDSNVEHFSRFTIGAATLVAIPAFTDMRLTSYPDDDDHEFTDADMEMPLDINAIPQLPGGDCGCGGFAAEETETTFAVNPDGWKGLPLAGRNSTFDNDDAVLRIGAWAGVGTGNVDEAKLRRAFMWHDPRLAGTATQSYRLPVGDIINGQLTLVYHAVYAAAALLSGAHGGLPNIPEEDKAQLRGVISGIYGVLSKEFNDPSVRAPWDDNRSGNMSADAEFAVTDDGYPVAPPKAWFADPGLTAKTPLTITADGRVFGHLAAWGECHRDVGARECVLAPKSRKGYAPFHLGTVETAEGDTVAVGKIVMDTRHAGINLGYAAAAIHYDHTGDEVAVVRAGEDAYGIWVAGSVVPEATTKKVAKLRRSPLSGDWRAVDGNLELTAALAVNVPAFPVYAMDGDDRLALVAAGTVYPDEDVEYAVVAQSQAWDETEAQLSDEQDDRRWKLLEILDDGDYLEQEERGRRLAKMFAADAATTPPSSSSTNSTPAGSAQTPASAATPAANTAGTNLGQMTPDQAMAARQLDSQFVILDDPAEDPANEDVPDPAARTAPAPEVTPTP